jgi:nucleotide-binding universal stress UspA family protein
LGNKSKIRYIIKKGKVFREIVNQANSYNKAVVSASTHGASGFEELFSGSNALKIMAATSQPVFTIKHSPVPNDIKKIVVPIKLHVDTRQKVPIAADLAELFGAEIHVLAISTSKNKRDMDRLSSYSRQVEAYLKEKKIPYVSKALIGESLPTLTCNYADAVEFRVQGSGFRVHGSGFRVQGSFREVKVQGMKINRNKKFRTKDILYAKHR